MSFMMPTCSNRPLANPTTNLVSTTTPTSMTIPAIFFPQQVAVDGDREVMKVEIPGTLIVVENRLRINA